MVGGLIQALISLNHEAYVAERWHQTLLTIAVVVSSVVFNTVLAVKLPLIEGLPVKLDIILRARLTNAFWGIQVSFWLCTFAVFSSSSSHSGLWLLERR